MCLAGCQGGRDQEAAGRAVQPAQRVPGPHGHQGGAGHGDCRLPPPPRVRGGQAWHQHWR